MLAFDEPDDGTRRRRLLWAMPAGIYVLGSSAGASGPWNLMTHSLAVQAAVEPCVLVLGVERDSRTHGLIEASGVCALSVLRRDQRQLVRRFVKPVDDIELDAEGRPSSMAAVPVALTATGAPYIADAAGCLDLRVVERVQFASHSLFCCEVVAAAVSAEVMEGRASDHIAEILRMEDTKMSYGG